MAAEVPLWTPTQDRIDASPLTAFLKAAEAKAGATFASYAELHRWSVEDREAFWSLVHHGRQTSANPGRTHNHPDPNRQGWYDMVTGPVADF